MHPLRRLMRKLEGDDEEEGGAPTWDVPDEEGALRAAGAQVSLITASRSAVTLDPVTMDDVLAALATTRPSAHMHSRKYEEWQGKFGAA